MRRGAKWPGVAAAIFRQSPFNCGEGIVRQHQTTERIGALFVVAALAFLAACSA